MARIPKGVRLLVADELAKRIRAALSEATPLAWWNLLSLAPTLLHAPDRSAPGTRPQSLSSSIRERLSATSTRTIPSVPPSHASRPSPPVSLSGDEALARRIRAKCADGDIRSALRLLSSSDSFASPTEDVIAALRAKHPPPPADQSFDTAAPRPGDRSLVASEEQVLSAVQSMPPGSSGGLDGFRAAHLRDLLSRGTAEAGQRLLSALTALVNAVLSGSLPAHCLPAFYGASLCALRKKDGGLRPIAVGSVFRRLAGRIGAKHLSDSLSAELRPVQLGVGTPLGCEAAVHAVREYVSSCTAEPSSPRILVKVDVKNAFNTVRRDFVLRQLRERCLLLYPMAWQAYHTPSPLHIGDDVITSSCGVQQGDPLGPALFALAVDPVARAMQSELNVWYLDDATLAGPPECVASDLRSLVSGFAHCGLTLNSAKCEVSFLGPSPPPPHSSALDTVRAVLPDVSVTTPDALSLLGSPISDPGLSSALHAASTLVSRLTDRLRALDRHTALFFLSHYVAVPRLTYLLRSAPVYTADNLLRDIDNDIRTAVVRATNVDLTDSAWDQASLPVRMGGLGVRRVSDLALPCYISSLQASLPLAREICARLRQDAPPQSLSSAVEAFSSLCGPGFNPNSLSPGTQRDWDHARCEVTRSRLLESANQLDRARLLAASHPHSGAWLQALPVASLGQLLDGESVRVAVALRLGAPVCVPHTCRCGLLMDRLGHHGLSCRLNAGRFPRHAHLNDVVKRGLASAGIPSILEPIGLDRGDGRRPDGLTVFPFCEGRCLVWDATCTDTFSSTALFNSATAAGSAARAAEDRKRRRYAEIAQHYRFEPLAAETSGVLGPAFASFLQELGRRITASSGDPRETAWIRQRVSLAIARGNALAILCSTRP